MSEHADNGPQLSAMRESFASTRGVTKGRLSFSGAIMFYRLVPLILVAALGIHSSAESPEELVTIEAGELPLILTAPHGGGEAIDAVPKREGDGIRLFRTLSDSGTDRLALELADAIEQRLGKRPFIIVAHFHRKFIDANRPADLAYESPNAAATYRLYHAAIEQARRQITERWGHGLLIDIHGQGANPQAIFRGTQNGLTMTHLTNRFGRKALIGPESLFGELATQGIEVVPRIDSEENEDPRYDGGFTVVTYGSGRGGTIDAIQLELGRSFRMKTATESTAKMLANAIIAFSDQHLPQREQEVPATAVGAGSK